MRYVTTVHLDCKSTPEDFLRAANRVWEKMGDPVGNKIDATAQLIAQMRGMVLKLTSPFEIRVGSLENEPIVIVHPGTREAGMKARKEAIEKGTWNTAVYEPRPRQAANYGKSRLRRENKHSQKSTNS